MRNIQFILLITFLWVVMIIPEGRAQISTEYDLYPACEPRSNTDPGRLNITARAENFGSIPPCRGTIEMYINKNSELRSLELDVVFLNRKHEPLAEQNMDIELEGLRTGMYSKEIPLNDIGGQTCRSVKVSIRSITCFSANGQNIQCPEIRVIPPDSFLSLMVEDKSLNVCRADM